MSEYNFVGRDKSFRRADDESNQSWSWVKNYLIQECRDEKLINNHSSGEKDQVA